MDQLQSALAQRALGEFARNPIGLILKASSEAAARDAALQLFHRTVAIVPAYAAFLAGHGVNAADIRTFYDFQRLPPTTKAGYILRHSLPALCRWGRLDSCDMIAVSSGSTGQPCFWPRFVSDEIEIAARFEQIFRGSFRAGERSTLAIVCFALGTWVGGMYTAACCRHLAAKGYPITVVTPGTSREDIFQCVRELSPHFDQTVLLGYPPFLKGTIDEGRTRGVDWTARPIKLVMAGEVFSEEWRTLVGERAGSTDPLRDSASLYGTADAGVLGCESPLSICVRRWLADNPRAARELFGESRLPTLVQYDPMSRYFEAGDDGALLFTGDNGTPLIRYNILDKGGVVTYDAMLAFLREWGFDPLAELGADRLGAWRLPFVYVFGRSDFTVSYFGANIYPENVTVGLEQPDIHGWVTGRFVMQVLSDADLDEYLSVTVELAPDSAPDPGLADRIATSIRDHLLRLNSEFASYVPAASQTPVVTLRSGGDPEYFPAGVKHRYTRR
ncbi:MAG TPA: hypothetical protein VKT77_22535 [Chthonomonadaceae bacterium]|nr:hypothetical protein [Chthonomonadaceae bacterium]